jgi:Flp pilus assembly protein TadG
MTGPTRSRTAATADRAPRWWGARDERGTSAVEFAIVTPIFLLLILVIIEAGLFFHARNAAQSASREGVSYLRLAGNNADPHAFVAAAEEVTEGYAREVGDLRNVDAVARLDESSGRVWVEVTGEVVLPVGGTITVTQTSTATLEQFRPDVRGAE